METPMCFLLGEWSMFQKFFVDGPIKMAPFNKHKNKKGCIADIINKKHENKHPYP